VGKTTTKPVVTVRIVRGGKATEHQKKLYGAWWARLISDCQRELRAEVHQGEEEHDEQPYQ
jgi:hypothetical protein